MQKKEKQGGTLPMVSLAMRKGKNSNAKASSVLIIFQDYKVRTTKLKLYLPLKMTEGILIPKNKQIRMWRVLASVPSSSRGKEKKT